MRLLCIDAKLTMYPVIGLVMQASGREELCCWDRNGNSVDSSTVTTGDLIEIDDTGVIVKYGLVCERDSNQMLVTHLNDTAWKCEEAKRDIMRPRADIVKIIWEK